MTDKTTNNKPVKSEENEHSKETLKFLKEKLSEVKTSKDGTTFSRTLSTENGRQLLEQYSITEEQLKKLNLYKKDVIGIASHLLEEEFYENQKKHHSGEKECSDKKYVINLPLGAENGEISFRPFVETNGVGENKDKKYKKYGTISVKTTGKHPIPTSVKSISERVKASFEKNESKK